MAHPKNLHAVTVPAVLVERVNFTSALSRLVFELEEPLAFAAGQYATLVLETGEAVLQRPYSICSAPPGNRLEFYLDLVPGGELTPVLWTLKPGDSVRVRKRAAGRFLFDDAAPAGTHLMIATATGAAPFLSMIRSRNAGDAALADRPRIILLHGARVSAEFGDYLPELQALDREPWFTYVPTVSRPWNDPGWTGSRGRVEDVLRLVMDRKSAAVGDMVAYACGNPVMIQIVRGILRRAGLPDDGFREERYYAPDDD